jgi:hypothetical protein
MARAQPTLGYRSRTDAVLALRNQGLSTREIGDCIGISAAAVTALEHSAGRGRRRLGGEPQSRTVLFPLDVLAALGPHAARRGMHPNSLARLVVEIVVADGLIDSVLDDGGDDA